MINNISINYPDFGVEINKSFTKGVNIISEENGYGKTTIAETIISSYSGRYNGKATLPKGTANINGDMVLLKQKWIGVNQNDLTEYCLPGKFFNIKTTVEQRKVFMNLLGLDYDKYMQDNIDGFNQDTESNIKKKLNELTIKSNLITEDLIQLSVIDNSVQDNFDDIKDIEKKISEYNLNINKRNEEYTNHQIELNKVKNEIFTLSNLIETNNKLLLDIKTSILSVSNDYIIATKKTSCSMCGSLLTEEQNKKNIDKIKDKGKILRDNEIKYTNKVNELNTELNNKIIIRDGLVGKVLCPATNISLDDINHIKNIFNIDVTEDRINLYKIYINNQAENKIKLIQKENKTNELININNTINNLRDELEKIKSTKKDFNNILDAELKKLPIQIEIFETQKNGVDKETFTIKYEGIDYYDHSRGNKLFIECLLSKIFIDKLGLDFIIIDEASILGSTNYNKIKNIFKDYQVLLFKAKEWIIT